MAVVGWFLCPPPPVGKKGLFSICELRQKKVYATYAKKKIPSKKNERKSYTSYTKKGELRFFPQSSYAFLLTLVWITKNGSLNTVPHHCLETPGDFPFCLLRHPDGNV